MTSIIPSTMQAMVLEMPGTPLQHRTVETPVPNPDQVLIRVMACGICRTDLHILDGELKNARFPLIPGHEIIGIVAARGSNVQTPLIGTIVGVPWLAYTCGKCRYCQHQRENLCENPLFTGYTVDGGYAEYTTAWAKYCFVLPAPYNTAVAAPLLCAGLIGYRSWRMLPDNATNVGLYGFGAAAHILTQFASQQGKSIYAFTKKDDLSTQSFALNLGATWAGSIDQAPPVKMDGAIIFAPEGSLIPLALSHVDKGGQIICGGIHMSDIPGFPYRLLWEERLVRSVANLTREDGILFFDTIARLNVKTSTRLFTLSAANEAIAMLRSGAIKGAAVLVPGLIGNH
ncbi:alcohol dehydrogenase, propanol-preferring [Chitinophaga sp. YR627]|uniref:zinc-dependent alcohol dehydrogenase family protein n=1 Tax=Chitinophaga sp. YR627 TaxID=1881041 RepID=UPI0008E5F15B|nr:zinc-dependent alcohol dehydrogenase family protein [Chitinophaga sp. YR627]SFM70946.1 alcohol dehydrogenase, propanol-preferring [Chitinophaga sp. YR627]